MKIYLAGRISNEPNYFTKFMEAAHELRLCGYDVINPVEINHGQTPSPATWSLCMRNDVRAMLTCEAICLLPDWVHSKGAKFEQMVATELGMRSYKYEELINMPVHGVTAVLGETLPADQTVVARMTKFPGMETVHTSGFMARVDRVDEVGPKLLYTGLITLSADDKPA